ncbi:MAG: putative peroxidase-related enzyme [Saprospiraceae bacterium]|jgi:uncharacterized peroxidase-related enzyme
MSWIKEITYENATGRLKRIYDRIKGPNDNIDNILSVHSLRPHTLVGHMTLYKNVLHHSNNTFPKWYLELLGVYVSYLNQCAYCVDHHIAGMKRLIDDEMRSTAVLKCLLENKFDPVLEKKQVAGIIYAEKLTKAITAINEQDFEALKSAGLDDGEILEINQVVSYFNYVNRTVLGLGVNTEGDIIGLSPNSSEDAENWSHK